MRKKLSLFLFISFYTISIGVCVNANEVVVYTSEDKYFSEPVLKDFENASGINVKAIYDTEETKSTGILNRLIAEKNNPRADVFWSGDPVRPIMLKGLLTPYKSPSSHDIPDIYKDKEGYWAGFSARSRVILYNVNLVEYGEEPQSIFDFLKPEWKGRAAVANPLFGTTSIHFAAIFVLLGDEQATDLFNKLKENDVRIVTSNGEVRRLVSRGEVAAGLTDTDDAHVALKEKSPVKIVFPDQSDIGTLIMPNMVCLIKEGPNPENGKKLIDYLLTREVEKKLAYADCAQMPLRYGVQRPIDVRSLDSIKGMDVSYSEVAKKLGEIGSFLKEWAGY